MVCLCIDYLVYCACCFLSSPYFRLIDMCHNKKSTFDIAISISSIQRNIPTNFLYLFISVSCSPHCYDVLRFLWIFFRFLAQPLYMYCQSLQLRFAVAPPYTVKQIIFLRVMPLFSTRSLSN